jgi:hypothetical protein
LRIVLFRKIFAGALLVTILAACGGGGNNQNSSSSTEASPGAAASPGEMATAGAMNAASPGGAMQGGNMQSIESRPQAPIPASLNCGADQPVWTNPRRHTYFEASAPFYGRTKSGTYMCPKDAIAAGYHLASGKRGHGGGSMEGAAPSPASTP